MINRYAKRYRAMQIEVIEGIKRKELKKKEGAEKLGISRVTLDKWLHRYNRFGEAGLDRQPVKKEARRIIELLKP